MRVFQGMLKRERVDSAVKRAENEREMKNREHISTCWKEIPNMRVVVLNLLDADNGRKQRIKIADIFASSLFSLLFFSLFWTTAEVARKRCLSLVLCSTHADV